MTEFGGADDKISLKLLSRSTAWTRALEDAKEIRAVAKRNKRVMDDGNFEMKNEKIKHTFKDENDARSA